MGDYERYGPPDVLLDRGEYKAGTYAPFSIIRSDGARILRGRRQLLEVGIGGNVADVPLSLVQCTTEDDKAITLGLHLETGEEPIGLGGQGSPVMARVQWGTEGGDNSVEVDLLQGTSFNLGCSYLRVVAFIDLGFDPPITGPASRTVSANVFVGGISSGAPPQRSFSRFAIAAAGFVDIAIPKYAANFDVCRTPFAGSYRIEQRDQLGAATIICQTDVGGGVDLPRKMSLTQLTRAVRFINTSGAVMDLASIIFGLNL